MKCSLWIPVMITWLVSCDSQIPEENMHQANYILSAQVKSHRTPSVHYLVFNQDSVIHRFMAGFADVFNQIPINGNTTFHAFSTTKTFTALAVMQLHENKMLDINEPAANYLPNFPYSANITIRQLMTHSAGIPNPNPLNWIHLEEEGPVFDRNGFFDPIFRKHGKTRSKPNEKFVYSNLGYVLLGQLIENVSGQTYEDYIRDHVLRPLDLGPEELDFEGLVMDRQATGYQKRFGLMNGLLGIFIDKSKFMDPASGRWKPFKKYHVNGASYGGLTGSPDAFRRYIQELLKVNGRLISDETKEELFAENFTNAQKPTGMCLSWFRGTLNGQVYYAHAGGGGGYYCELRVYPQIGMGSVIMYNRTGMRDERFLDQLDTHFVHEK